MYTYAIVPKLCIFCSCFFNKNKNIQHNKLYGTLEKMMEWNTALVA